MKLSEYISSTKLQKFITLILQINYTNEDKKIANELYMFLVDLVKKVSADYYLLTEEEILLIKNFMEDN